jgi:hypothetical protein
MRRRWLFLRGDFDSVVLLFEWFSIAVLKLV